MPRFLPLLLLLLLQPRAAAAEVLAYGYMAYVAPVAAAAPEPPRHRLLASDVMDEGARLRCPADRSDRVPPETGSRARARLRAPLVSPAPRASAGFRAGPCSPLCERLPYDATAPPGS